MRFVLALASFVSLCGLTDGCWPGNWKDWSSWGPCTEACGGGQMGRRREKCTWYVADVQRQYKPCNEICNNGGSYSAGSCHCPSWRDGRCCDVCRTIAHCHWGGERCHSTGAECTSCVSPYYPGGLNRGCQACKQIDHCVDRHCTTATEVKCRKCEPTAFVFKLRQDGTACDRLCSWNGHQCWPGTCTGTLGNLTTNCRCASGFHKVSSGLETKCQLDVDNSPSITTCEVTALGPAGEKIKAPKTSNSSDCQYKTDFFGNFQVRAMQYDYAASFDVDTNYAPPKFISESKFGITESRVFLQQKDVYGRDVGGEVVQQGIHDNTKTAEPTDFKQDSISVAANISNGERWCIGFEAKGGGYLISQDLTTNMNSIAKPYSKTNTIRKLCYAFDDVQPVHCNESVGCTHEPLHVSERITRSPEVSVTFDGWFDPFPIGGTPSQASGIEHYDVSLHEVWGSTGPLKVSLLPIKTVKLASSVKHVTLNLTWAHPVLYCISLPVKDVAGNVRQARRFVLYDNTSQITSSHDTPFYMTSASKATNYTWQTHHNDICLNWKNHFFNNFYFDNPLLKPIEPAALDAIPISSIYEQSSGQLPVNGTRNVDGITGYKLSWAVNSGNMSKEEPVRNFQSQSICKTYNLKDGQTYTINIRAGDIVNNTYSENRTIHIDRTVPHINRVGLSTDGYRRLYVHDSKDLSEMTLEFEALDPHSGVRDVHWTFGTGDGNGVLASGALGVINKECANASSCCYCPDVGLCEMYNYSISLISLVADNKHRGDNNRTYYFTITVTNHAGLSNTEHVDILVDESPPEPVVVFEGPPEMPIDPRVEDVYTTSVNISWELGYHGGPGQISIIQYSTDGETWTDGATLDTGNSTSQDRHYVTVDSLSPGTLYSLRIHAYNQHGSLDTDMINVTTSTIGPPGMPIDPRVEDVYTTSVNVSWELGYHGGPGQIFIIQYSTDGETWTDGATLDTGNSTSQDRHYVTVDSLSPGTLYSLRIHAYNQHGRSLDTDMINVTTSTIGMPIDPRVEYVYTTSVNVSWELGYHGGPGQIFIIQYSTDGETWTDGATLDTGNSTSQDRHYVTVDSLSPGTLYSLRIHAYNQHGSLDTDMFNVTTSAIGADRRTSSSAVGPAVGGSAAALIVIALVVGLVVLHKKGYSIMRPCTKKSNTYRDHTHENEVETNETRHEMCQARDARDEGQAAAFSLDKLTTTRVTTSTMYDVLNITGDGIVADTTRDGSLAPYETLEPRQGENASFYEELRPRDLPEIPTGPEVKNKRESSGDEELVRLKREVAQAKDKKRRLKLEQEKKRLRAELEKTNKEVAQIMNRDDRVSDGI